MSQRFAEVVGGRDFLQHIIGVERELVVDVRADAAEVHAPGHGMARIGQQRLGELQLGLRLLFRAADVELRHPVIFRIEPIGLDGAEIFHHVPGALARRALRDPERLEVAGLLIERDDGVAVGLARHHAVELFAGDDLANLVADFGLGRGIDHGRFHGGGSGRTRGSSGRGDGAGHRLGSRSRRCDRTRHRRGGRCEFGDRLRRGDDSLGLCLGAGRLRRGRRLGGCRGFYFGFAPQFVAGRRQRCGAAGGRQRAAEADAVVHRRRRLGHAAWCAVVARGGLRRLHLVGILRRGGGGGRYRQDQRQRGAGEKTKSRAESDAVHRTRTPLHRARS